MSSLAMPTPASPTVPATGPAQLPAVVPAYAGEHGIDAEQLEAARIRLELLYGEVAADWPGFIARPGQYEMMQACLLTFLSARASEDTDRSGSHLAQLEAGTGTGTGKTVAYCLAAIVAAEVLKKTVMISTATVALQEQLIHKDLPRLSSIIPELTFDILKGRARYVCQSRLEGVIEGIVAGSELAGELQDLFADSRRPAASVVRDRQAAMRWFKSSAKKLNAGAWDGDIDSLAQSPDPQDWRQVQANAHACNGGQCQHFRDCAFFKARRQAADATLQVANHALVLATLQTDSRLIDAGATLFVFDEAHHLPVIAAEQFSYRARLGASTRLLF